MSAPQDEIVRRELETDGGTPAVQIAEIVADLEGKRPEELTPTYDYLGDVTEAMFSEPPVPEAQVEITVSYEHYRITIEQNGRARFIKTA